MYERDRQNKTGLGEEWLLFISQVVLERALQLEVGLMVSLPRAFSPGPIPETTTLPTASYGHGGEVLLGLYLGGWGPGKAASKALWTQEMALGKPSSGSNMILLVTMACARRAPSSGLASLP